MNKRADFVHVAFIKGAGLRVTKHRFTSACRSMTALGETKALESRIRP